jgi:hypothetical protein
MSGTGPPARTVVLVEGASDQAAVLAVATRLGRNLSGERILVAATGGATNIARHLELLGPHGRGVRLAGLYDAAEERFVHGGLRRAGLGQTSTRTDLEELGFFACVDDLEEELIRALGVDAVLGVIERQRDLSAFHILQRQPAHRERTDAQRLRRFLGTTSGRKVEYAALLAAELDVAALPRPLARLFAWL